MGFMLVFEARIDLVEIDFAAWLYAKFFGVVHNDLLLNC